MSGLQRHMFRVNYSTATTQTLLAQPDTLAVIGFGDSAPVPGDPRQLQVPLKPAHGSIPHEHWSVGAPVAGGRDGDLHWSAGGGWRFVAIEVETSRHGGVDAASEYVYRRLLGHIAAAPESHLQRIWNYLDAINSGSGDQERYRLFCNGRARGLSVHGVNDYPAATAIGHNGRQGLLQVYALSATRSGRALENPRQVSAWQYPRQYGPTSPNFARAMILDDGSLAISGTAAVIGHASHHQNDVLAQADEAFANLRTLLERAALPTFDARSPLKVYVRHESDVPVVEAWLQQQLDPAVPRVLLHGDICRSELLIEIDGWRFAPSPAAE